MTLYITSVNSLEQAALYCHDAIIDTDRIVFDEKSHTVNLPMVREMWEKAEKGGRILLIFQRWKIPRIASELVFRNVVEVNLHIKEPQDILEEIYYDPELNELSLNCMLGTEVRLTLETLDGVLEDIGRPYNKKPGFVTFRPTYSQ